MPRLATCHHCHIIERLPDVPASTPSKPARLVWETGEEFIFRDDDGLPTMVPAYDPLLEDFTIRHQHHYTDEDIIKGLIQVAIVDQKTWDTMDVVTKVKDEMAKIHGQSYAEKQEYREAATKCYNDHGNPTTATGCRDYLDETKRIGPGQYDDGEGHVVRVPNKFRQYLCYQCPFQQAYVNVEMRRKKGYYRENWGGKPTSVR